MSNNYPRCLHKAPIVEFVWEVRFSSELTNISEVLPGLLYSKLRPSHVSKLPHANLPPEVLLQDPNLRYIPTVRLDWEVPYIIQLGEHVISLNGQRPYSSWSDFKGKIEKVVQLLKEIDLIKEKEIERFSIKYINVLSSKNHAEFPLNAQLKLGEHNLTQQTFHVRTDLREGDFLQIIQVISPLKAELGTETLEGTLIDIDTIYDTKGSRDFLKRSSELLDDAHELNKKTFFDFLTENSLSELEPEY